MANRSLLRYMLLLLMVSLMTNTMSSAASVQESRKSTPAKDHALSIQITGNYLNLPIDELQAERHLSLKDTNGKPIAALRLRPALDRPVFWASIDVRQYKGQTVTLTVDPIDQAHKALEMIHQTETMLQLDAIYKKPYRPQYHFSPRRGWMNDPNGLFYYKGVYHLFFQHYDFPHKSWGHATSTDLLHWTEHEDALVPQDGFQVFSGSCVVDYNNTSGFQTGSDPPIVALFTAWGDGQHLACSNDGGWTWTRYGRVLSLPSDEKQNFPLSARDPIVIWHSPTRRWVMVLYQNFDQSKTGKAFGFYSSPDLKTWTYESRLPGFYVCPDLFELPVEGEPGLRKWVILDWDRENCKYAIGTFDGHRFTTEVGPFQLVYGKGSHAATQTWKQGPAGDRRLIQMVNEWRGSYPGEPFKNQMSVPLELRLRRMPAGFRLCRMPIKEVASLYRNSTAWEPFDLTAGQTRSMPMTTRSFALEASLTVPAGGQLTVEVLGHPITVHHDGILFDGHTGKLPGTTVKQLKILADITSVEVFVNNGELVMLYLMEPPAQPQPVKLTAGQDVDITFGGLSVHEVASIWTGAMLRDDILIADFERDDYGDWDVTGDAFGNHPVQGPFSERQKGLDGYNGSALVNTYRNGNHLKGTLTSPSFKVERDYINFLVGGGGSEYTTVSLLYQGKIVRYTTGGQRPDLRQFTFDVSEFKGKDLQLQIVDLSGSHLGFILVDDLYQSDAPAVKTMPNSKPILMNHEMTIEITGNYLNLPVDDAQTEHYLILNDEKGTPVTDFRISLAKDRPVFWASVDVRRYKGRTITLVVDRMIEGHKALAMIHQTDNIPERDSLYHKPYRPQFHFSPRVGWVNDPNGLVYYNGVYHLFYQYNPYGMKWNNMHWGYATSTDLVHWTDHGVGFIPDFQKEAYSGSGVVDWHNTTGLQTGEHPPILLFYTECGQRFVQDRSQRKTPQKLVYSVDGGLTWTKYSKPVIKPFTQADGKSYYVDRDPIVRWYPPATNGSAVTSEPSGYWVMMLYVGGQTFRVFQSDNALDWTPVSDMKVEGHNECPDLFQIAVENDPTDKKWVFISGAGSFGRGDCAKYVIGNFDGKKFTKEQDSILMDSGVGNYSTQTFSDSPDGRRIYLAWYTRSFGSVGYLGMPANAQFRVPWELTLYKTEAGYRLRRLPVEEIKSLRGKQHHFENVKLESGQNPTGSITHNLLDIEAEIVPGKAGSFGFRLLGMEIKYDIDNKTLHAFKRTAELEPVAGKLKFRILLDRTSIELFANDGTCVMTGLFMPDDTKSVIELFASDTSTTVKKLDLYEMNSIWPQSQLVAGL